MISNKNKIIKDVMFNLFIICINLNIIKNKKSKLNS